VADFAYPRKGKDVVKNLRKAPQDEQSPARAREEGREAANESWATSAVVYMAPEILTAGESSCAGDVYAFGMLTYEVMARKDPYSDQDCSLVEILKEIVKGELDVAKRLPIPAQANPSIVSVYRDCAHMRSAMRPHFGEVERRLRSLRTSLEDANGNTKGSARSFEPANIDRHNIDGNTQSAAFRRSKTLRRGSGQSANPTAIQQLLLEVFPSHVAKALMEGRKVEPESKACVTIFFSDIVGYTELGGSMEPHLVMNMLDRLYTKFDVLSEKYDVFKVETIGDAYMAVANLHKDQSADHVHRLACFARAAVDAAAKTLISVEHPHMGTVRIRVGFHCGPVVATVVGKKNPRYCLFGDTVNMASRMESNSVAGKILCSLSAGNLLLAQAPASQLEKLEKEVKGKGLMQCFWVDVVSDPFVDAAALVESLEGNSIALEDEKAAVVSAVSSGLKGEIVNEGGDVHIAIQPQVCILPSLPGEADESQNPEGGAEVTERCLALGFRGVEGV
jgi:class 3 adenylate cyclase